MITDEHGAVDRIPGKRLRRRQPGLAVGDAQGLITAIARQRIGKARNIAGRHQCTGHAVRHQAFVAAGPRGLVGGGGGAG